MNVRVLSAVQKCYATIRNLYTFFYSEARGGIQNFVSSFLEPGSEENGSP